MLRPNPSALAKAAPVVRTGYSWALLINLDSAPPPLLLNEDLTPVGTTPENGGLIGGEVVPGGAIGAVVGIDGGDDDPIQPEPVAEPVIPSLSLDEQILFATDTLNFYYNPEEQAYSREANYSEGDISGANVQPLQWISSSGSSLRLTDLILDTDDEGRTIQPWLNQIQSYMTAVPQLGRPPELAFVFGEKRYAPVVLESVDWTETAWTNGLPTRASVSMVLRKQATEEDLPVLPPEIELVPESTLSGQIQIPSGQNTADGSPVTVAGGGVPGGNDEASFRAATLAVPGEPRGSNVATGVAFSSNQLLTAYHVVQGWGGNGTEGQVYPGSENFADGLGEPIEVTLIDFDQAEDIALLETVSHTFATFAVLGDNENLKVGDEIVTFGYPGGDAGEERTTGTVVDTDSNRDSMPSGLIEYTPGLLYPGNSGGPQWSLSGSEAGKVISLTRGGTGSSAKAGVNTADGLTAQEMDVSECWSIKINTCKTKFGIS